MGEDPVFVKVIVTCPVSCPFTIYKLKTVAETLPEQSERVVMVDVIAGVLVKVEVEFEVVLKLAQLDCMLASVLHLHSDASLQVGDPSPPQATLLKVTTGLFHPVKLEVMRSKW